MCCHPEQQERLSRCVCQCRYISWSACDIYGDKHVHTHRLTLVAHGGSQGLKVAPCVGEVRCLGCADVVPDGDGDDDEVGLVRGRKESSLLDCRQASSFWCARHPCLHHERISFPIMTAESTWIPGEQTRSIYLAQGRAGAICLFELSRERERSFCNCLQGQHFSQQDPIISCKSLEKVAL